MQNMAVESGLEELKKRLMEDWSYPDVVALAVARSKSSQFTSWVTRWSEVMWEFRQLTNGAAPELTEDIYFDLRDPNAPLSLEVEGLLAGFRRSGVFFRPYPGQGVYMITPEARQSIRDGQSLVLKRYEGQIAILTGMIDQKLAVEG